MAKTHTASDGRTITHQHGDYVTAQDVVNRLANSKKT
jgi:hypothetical protein